MGYVEDLGITNRWLVIHGDAEFFAILKRVHNRIHGSSDRASLGDAEADHYRRDLSANAVELLQQIRPGDIVLLQDPQSAGLAAPLAEAGALVVWRCHIGLGTVNDITDSAWAFLRPYVTAADASVFSRRPYVPSWLTGEDVCSTLSTAGISIGVLLLALPVAGAVKGVGAWLPTKLLTAPAALVTGAAMDDYVRPVVVSLLATVMLLLLAVHRAGSREV